MDWYASGRALVAWICTSAGCRHEPRKVDPTTRHFDFVGQETPYIGSASVMVSARWGIPFLITSKRPIGDAPVETLPAAMQIFLVSQSSAENELSPYAGMV